MKRKVENSVPEASDQGRTPLARENRRDLFKAGLFAAAAIAVILLLKVLLGY